jgi:hypothetical protein
MRQAIGTGGRINLLQVLDHRACHLGAALAAAGEREEEEGSIARAGEVIGTGGQKRLQRLPGEGGLRRTPPGRRSRD